MAEYAACAEVVLAAEMEGHLIVIPNREDERGERRMMIKAFHVGAIGAAKSVTELEAHVKV